MWNRVALSALGMAFGWNLVNYWTVAWDDRGRYLYRIIISLAGAILLVGLLATLGAAPGILAIIILSFAALVAYAARAKMLGKENADQGHEKVHAEAQGHGAALIVVAETEPKEYDGPAPWVRYLGLRQAVLGRSPHWFIRPYLLRRVRDTFRAAGPDTGSASAMSHLCAYLSNRLQIETYPAHPWASPDVTESLRQVVRAGYEHIIVLPIDLDPVSEVDLGQQIDRVGIVQQAPVVEILPNLVADIWWPERVDAAVETRLQGMPPPISVNHDNVMLDRFCATALQHVEQVTGSHRATKTA